MLERVCVCLSLKRNVKLIKITPKCKAFFNLSIDFNARQRTWMVLNAYDVITADTQPKKKPTSKVNELQLLWKWISTAEGAMAISIVDA